MVDDDAGCSDARFSTIQSAVDAARPGDGIRVCAGRYRESLTVSTDRLTIVSRPLHQAVIEPQTHAILLGGRGTLFRGFTITGGPGGDCEPSGEAISVFAPATIDYNRIVDPPCHTFDEGVELDPLAPGRITVAHNEILDIGSDNEGATGIRARGDASIHSNVIRGTSPSSAGFPFGGHGIVFDGSVGKIQDNTIEDNGAFGIIANGLERRSFIVWISGNRLRRNGAGIEVRLVGIPFVEGPFNVRVEGNGVFDNARDGIRLRDMGPTASSYIFRNRSLGNGGFDCADDESSTAVWKENIGLTDSPPTLCSPP